MATGIRDKVAILGMGCSKFGERWESGAEELMVEAYLEALGDAGVETSQIQAAWFGTAIEEQHVGKGGTPLSVALRLPNIPVTRVENFCASRFGSISRRGLCGGGGCVRYRAGARRGEIERHRLWRLAAARRRNACRRCGAPTVRRPAISRSSRAPIAPSMACSKDDLKRAIAHVSVKSHANGTKNPKAHLQKAITEEQCLNAPMIAEPLGLFDCCGVSDGAACAIVTTPEIAKAMGKKDIITVKALQLSLSNGLESQHNSWDGSYFHTARIASKRAYEEAGIKNPRDEVSMMEVHDCFSITELVTMEDLHISKEGEGWKDVMNGFYDADGQVPCQIDGGLKCFGHPIGAIGPAHAL